MKVPERNCNHSTGVNEGSWGERHNIIQSIVYRLRGVLISDNKIIESKKTRQKKKPLSAGSSENTIYQNLPRVGSYPLNEYLFFKEFILKEAELGETPLIFSNPLKESSTGDMVVGQHAKYQSVDDSDGKRRKLSLGLLLLVELVL